MKFDLLVKFAEEQNLNINSDQITQIERFADILIEKNKVMNLTAITDPEEIEIKHMIDSLEGISVINEIAPKEFTLLDVGCGAGFPGIPLKIAYPDNEFTLLDSLNKRINFVNEVADTLGLDKITAIAVRAEDFKNREKYDICTSRAVAAMNILLEYCLPFVKVGGYCLLYKSGDFNNELETAENSINVLGGELFRSYTFELPNNGGSRSIVAIRKVRITPDKYPRRAGKPAKNPL